jgi:uncharacterized protein
MSDSPFASPNFASDDDLDQEDLDDQEDFGEEDLDEDDQEDEDDLDEDDQEDEDDLDEDDEDDEESLNDREPGAAAADDRGNRLDGGRARAVLEHAARSIVDDPDAVLVDSAPGRSGVLLSLHVAPGDMGRIIGKRGRVAQALRSLVRAAAARDGTDATVDIVD